MPERDLGSVPGGVSRLVRLGRVGGIGGTLHERSDGGQHADEFGTYGLVWHDGTDADVFISFTSDLEAHRAALDQIVQFPDDLIVCQAALPGDVSRALQAKLATDLNGRVVSIAQGAGPIEIGLPSGEEALASELRALYGDAVEVTLGACPFAVDTTPTNC